jgi:mannose-6-phosphate isomerase-like protein (cupin superfamily)
MRTINIGLLGVVIGLCGGVAFAQRGAERGGTAGQATTQGGGLVLMPVLMTAPTDKAVYLSAKDLQGKYAQMEEKRAGAWRLIDGMTHTVNIRMGTDDAPAIHPNTVDVWLIARGTGTVTTGGRIVDGRIVGGVDQVVGPGDIMFIPATVPHGLRAQKPVTFMNIRYDMVEKARR